MVFSDVNIPWVLFFFFLKKIDIFKSLEKDNIHPEGTLKIGGYH